MFFGAGDGSSYLLLQNLRVGLLVRIEIGANFGSDGKTRGNGKSDLSHFGKVRALAAQKGTLRSVSIGFIAKVIDVLWAIGFTGSAFLSAFLDVLLLAGFAFFFWAIVFVVELASEINHPCLEVKKARDE